ncbi:hypothetical protein C8F01DRAFT_322782 [Mycena amicta]|nr:hypothetical protein C8F01DRAFT_322782 [Mycena amicta]
MPFAAEDSQPNESIHRRRAPSLVVPRGTGKGKWKSVNAFNSKHNAPPRHSLPYRVPNIPPPQKRRRIAVVVKTEPRSPSPSPRRAATSGSKRYFPVPRDCTRLDPNYVANRRKWAQRESSVLRNLGLRVLKFFFRDDGMVIEWESTEEVWLDTLLRVRGRHVTVPEEREIIDLDADLADPTAVAESPTVPSQREMDAGPAEIIDVHDVAPDSPVYSPTLSAVQSDDDDEDVMSFEEEEAYLSQSALDFLRKFIMTFDTDRASLVTAYSDEAILSFRDNNFACPTKFTVRRSPAANSNSKPSLPKLPVLDGFRFVHEGGCVDIDYDLIVLDAPHSHSDAAARPPATDVMLTVHGEVVHANQRTLAIDQAFVLRRRMTTRKQRDKDDEGCQWPLVVLSHQIVVRDTDTPWVQWTGKLEDLGRRY